MAYADTLRQAVFNPSDCADLIEGGLPITESTETSTTTTTSSTTLSSLISDSITITETSDIRISFLTNGSSSVAGGNMGLQIYKDGSPLNSFLFWHVAATADSNGTAFTRSIEYIDRAVAAGTYTYAIYWRRGGTTTTLYAEDRSFQLQALTES